jgi:CheY-specific phosphatase CheX
MLIERLTEGLIHQAMHDAVVEVLEKMFFIEAGGEPLSDPAPREPGMLVEIAFDGDPPGSFRMSLPRTAAARIAADFLGEDLESVTANQVDEVTKELANMICGAVLSRIESSASFRLSAPCLADALAEGAIFAGTVCAVETGGGILTAGIDMGKRQCSPSARSAS